MQQELKKSDILKYIQNNGSKIEENVWAVYIKDKLVLEV